MGILITRTNFQKSKLGWPHYVASNRKGAKISKMKENLILMKEMSKKCPTDQRFILKEIISEKIHTLVRLPGGAKSYYLGTPCM